MTWHLDLLCCTKTATLSILVKPRRSYGSANDEYLTYASEHEHADGIVHHLLVVDGHELLADALGDGVKPCAGASC